MHAQQSLVVARTRSDTVILPRGARYTTLTGATERVARVAANGKATGSAQTMGSTLTSTCKSVRAHAGVQVGVVLFVDQIGVRQLSISLEAARKGNEQEKEDNDGTADDEG